ncbi:MAG: macro domain-containing protein, partial [Verrucomicrobiae bacterium]|nr:macro domain-containing protein [Verrucomicrobiae bacterium]
AIHRAGGPAILEECRKLGGCETGDAKITTGGNLPARFVIHTAGPVWGDGDEDAKLRRACISSLALADDKGLKSIAFPAISTGIYRFPLERAARVLLRAAADYLSRKTGLQRVIFCLYDEKTYDEFARALSEM